LLLHEASFPKQVQLCRSIFITLMQIIVGNEDFGELRSVVVPLLDVVDTGKGFRLNARCFIETADKFTVVVGQQEFAVDPKQRIPQTDVVFFCKAVLAHIFVIAFGFKIWWIAVEEAHRAVVLPDELLEILVFDNHLGKPPVCLLYEGKVAADVVGLAAVAGKPRCVAVADELVKPCRPLHIRCGTVTGKGIFHKFKICAGVETIGKHRHQLLRFISHTAVEVHQQAVEVVIDLKIVAGLLMEQHPSAPAEHFNVPLIIERKQGDDQLPQGFLASDPGHEAVQESSPPFSSGRRSCVSSKAARECRRPVMAALIPLMRFLMCRMVMRTSASVFA